MSRSTLLCAIALNDCWLFFPPPLPGRENVSEVRVFVVVQAGVYLHDMWGPFATAKEAIARAEEIAAADRDDYHDYDICPIDPRGGLGKSIATRKGPTRHIVKRAGK